MKSKEMPKNQQSKKKPILGNRKIREIQQCIKSRRNDIQWLFAFASGAKKMPVRSNPTPLLPTERTEADDKRMLFSVGQAREQIRNWEQELLAVEEQA